jgi:cell division protein FtsZ
MPMAASRDGSGSNNPSNEDLVKSRLPHRLPGGRGAFLGFRNTKELPPSLNPLRSSVQPLMPDGGLSPCVIRVLGVGGGGCNAVDRMLETAGKSFRRAGKNSLDWSPECSYRLQERKLT